MMDHKVYSTHLDSLIPFRDKMVHVCVAHSSSLCFTFDFQSLGRDYGGACVQCCHKDCLVAFHPYCAFTSDRSMATRIDSGGYVHYEICCKKHDPRSKQETVEDRKLDEVIKSSDMWAEGDECCKSEKKSLGGFGLNLSSPYPLRDSPSNALVDTALKDPLQRKIPAPKRRRYR